jgi:hypothetical protein
MITFTLQNDPDACKGIFNSSRFVGSIDFPDKKIKFVPKETDAELEKHMDIWLMQEFSLLIVE